MTATQMDTFNGLATRLGATLKVVGHHRSRSCELPVVALTLPGVGTFTLRDNFYDVNLLADLIAPCTLTLREFFAGVQAPKDWAWYMDEVKKAREYSWREWTDDEMEDPRILRAKDRRPGVNYWSEKRGEEKDRWAKRLTDPNWWRRDWSSGVLTCDGAFGPDAEIYIQHHAFAEGIDDTDADPAYARGAKRFILAFGSVDQVAAVIERIRDSVSQKELEET